MKKIVGILAAAAVLATSVFAADVSAKVRLDGEIFNYDGTAVNEKDDYAGAFRMLRTTSQARPYWSPYVTLSTSTDEAGAQIMFIEEGVGADDKDGDGGRNIRMDRSNVWFKPLDMLTVKVGWQDFTMNKESIDYNPNPTGTEGWGYGIGYAQDAISANVYLATGNNEWFYEDAIAKYNTAEDPYTAYVKELYVNAAYAADFGTISAMFAYYGKSLSSPDEFKDAYTEKAKLEAAVAAATIAYQAAPTDATKAKALEDAVAALDAFDAGVSFNPQTIKFGAGYSNTIDNLFFFADVIGTSKSALTDKEKDAAVDLGVEYAATKDGDPRSVFGLMVDGFVKYDMDALTLKGYVRFDVDDFGALNEKGDADITYKNNTKLGLKFRADYKLDNGITLFAQFNDDNLLRKENTDAKKPLWEDASAVFVSEIKLGATGSVGICDYETKLVFNTGVDPEKGEDAGKFNKVKVSMPIWFQVAF